LEDISTADEKLLGVCVREEHDTDFYVLDQVGRCLHAVQYKTCNSSACSVPCRACPHRHAATETEAKACLWVSRALG
jgi:hypothetical protein